jgi:hypothetical protein
MTKGRDEGSRVNLFARAMVLSACGVAVLAAVPASAQYHDRNRNVSVRERPQPGYDPIGVPVGAFRAYFNLPLGATYTNNVFATPNGQEDYYLWANPSAELRSQWSNHQAILSADVRQLSFQDFASEDRTDVNLNGFGRIDVQRGFNVSLNGRQSWLEEPRTDASAPANTLSPVEFDQTQLGANVSKEFNRLRLSGGGSFLDSDYDNALFADGVTVAFQDDRDHEWTSVTGRADYGLTPTTAIFGMVSASERSYDLQPGDDPNVLFTRDSEGLVYALGANFDITNLVRGEVSLGYLSENFANVAVSDTDGLAAFARVEWFPTPLATFEFSAQRSVTDTGVVGAVASLTTTIAARVDYEVRRNVVLTGQISHRDDEFEGISRDDAGLAAAVDVLYLFNAHVGASVSLQHAERDSGGAASGPSFDQESLGLSLVLRY